MQTKTIAQLEAESNAACAAHDASEAALGAMGDMRRALIKVEDESVDGALPETFKAKLRALGIFSLIQDLDARIAAEKIERDRLEDICHETARALNDAPEEAA